MTKQFDETLRESIRKLEASAADIESILRDHPEHAAELRAHLQVWASLCRAEKREASPTGYTRGLNQLTSALRQTGQEQGGNRLMNDISRSTGFTLKLLGAAAVAAGLVFGFAYLSGNMDVEFGDEAQANHTHACLDSVLGNLADPQDNHFTFEDLLAFRQAFQDQNTDTRYDTDGDGDVDIDDIMFYVQALKDCFGPPAP